MHEPGRRRVEAETEREQHVDREVDPEDLQREKRLSARDVEDRRAQEREDEPEQEHHLDADVLHQVVVEATAALDRGDDRGEVVVGEDHLGRVLRHLGAGDPHGDADVGAGESRCVVHTVAGHRDDVALTLQEADQAHLVFGSDTRDHTDAVELREQLIVGHRRELGTGERAALDAELARDRGGGRGVVAGDHPHPDARVVAQRDRVLRLLAGRVDDADERQELEVVDEGQEVG